MDNEFSFRINMGTPLAGFCFSGEAIKDIVHSVNTKKHLLQTFESGKQVGEIFHAEQITQGVVEFQGLITNEELIKHLSFGPMGHVLERHQGENGETVITKFELTSVGVYFSPNLKTEDV